jgi:hypothetical protein
MSGRFRDLHGMLAEEEIIELCRSGSIVYWHIPMLVLRHTAPDDFVEQLPQLGCYRTHFAATDRAMVYLGYGGDLGGGSSQKQLLAQIDFGPVNGALHDL